ncbi:hypothetical protein chiPu_0012132 [Chiloscyllium punctatum]|uniref:Uncharacterized protein n=1 Tax=Chiloscyllium punctatum TaxID=137246 RepID=A0A401STG8_CHIPU|nr:hypothetical protein [Chiloscyllium punctatum]
MATIWLPAEDEIRVSCACAHPPQWHPAHPSRKYILIYDKKIPTPCRDPASSTPTASARKKEPGRRHISRGA